MKMRFKSKSTGAALLLLFLANAASPVRADGMRIDYTAEAVDLNPRQLPSEDGEVFEAYRQMLLAFWKRPEKMPAVHHRLSESLVRNKLVLQVMGFAREFDGRSDSFAANYHSEFMRSIGHGTPPGYAWFVMVEKIGYDIDTFEGTREGGGVGVQIPIVGSKDLWLKNGDGQLVLRVMPLAGNYEQVKVQGAMGSATEKSLVVRPSVELEGAYQVGQYLMPGFRVLGQPKIQNPIHTRMIAEVFVEVISPHTGPVFTRISIVPRCLLDFSTDELGGGISSREREGFKWAYDLLNRNTNCSVFAKFSFGL